MNFVEEKYHADLMWQKDATLYDKQKPCKSEMLAIWNMKKKSDQFNQGNQNFKVLPSQHLFGILESSRAPVFPGAQLEPWGVHGARAPGQFSPTVVQGALLVTGRCAF